jgi:hypothetical protein
MHDDLNIYFQPEIAGFSYQYELEAISGKVFWIFFREAVRRQALGEERHSFLSLNLL